MEKNKEIIFLTVLFIVYTTLTYFAFELDEKINNEINELENEKLRLEIELLKLQQE